MSDNTATAETILLAGQGEISSWGPHDLGPELAEALVNFQGEVGAVAKDTANPFFKSKYADLPAVKAEAQPLLKEHGLAVIQEPGYDVIDGKLHDTLTTTVVHKSGQAKASTMVLKPVKNDPQAQGSAITYAKRYAFMAVLGLVADEDDDGNAASGRGKAPARKAASKPVADDGVDNTALAAAKATLKAAAQAAGASGKDVVDYFQSEFDDNFVSTRSIANLELATAYYVAQKALSE